MGISEGYLDKICARHDDWAPVNGVKGRPSTLVVDMFSSRLSSFLKLLLWFESLVRSIRAMKPYQFVFSISISHSPLPLPSPLSYVVIWNEWKSYWRINSSTDTIFPWGQMHYIIKRTIENKQLLKLKKSNGHVLLVAPHFSRPWGWVPFYFGDRFGKSTLEQYSVLF